MNPQFKKRVQAAQQSELGASAAASDEHSATRNHHTLPPHLPGLVPSSALYSSQIGRTTGGAIRTSVANVRAARSRGVPGIPAGAGVVRTVLGHSAPLSSTATISTPAANVTTASPRRAPTPALATGHSTKRATRTDGSTTTLSNSLGTIKKTKASDAASSDSLNNISKNNTNADNSNNIHSTRNSVGDNSNNNGNVASSKVINSTERAGSVVNQNSVSSEGNSNKNNQVTNGVSTTTNLFENFNVSGSSTILRSPGMKSPSKKIVFDRYIPVREGGLSEHYDLLPEPPSTPSRQRTRNMPITPNQASHISDHYKKAQNQAHDTVIANELMLSNAQNPHENHLTSTPRRLFAYASTTTHNTIHFDSPSRQIYAPTPVSQESRSLLLSPKKAPRSISKLPFKVLDAPELRDDFYLNLVDWSSQNVLGVGLGNSVYLWSALTSKVTQLCELGEGNSVTSLSWISMGTHLAVGTDKGTIQIWDVQYSRKVRTMTGHSQRVGVLAWSDHTLTSGSRDRNIYHRDVRSQEMWQHCLAGHHGEVCGLKWNSSGTQLASGGNDNKLLVWEKDTTVPLYRFRDHTAAVKAIDWSPHQSGLLASGGGTADQHIRFWNTATGVSTGATNTGSQVCNLAWSRTTNELVSTHGYSQNQIFVWKYPAMQQIAMLTAHTYRVLYLALSPDGQTIVTGAGDETLRFWNVFQKSKSERRDDEGLSSVVTTIR
ncbi:substrate-specific activator of APC-dependent proteolysis [Mortierella sp. AD011]|nr:substrate-specific activator of APC-dependent proteolysis [Mortierella sp. AD010]KAF9391562.1 substrate-specific activator of APC-dependent proteolysis [Mortierella sp. AD011]